MDPDNQYRLEHELKNGAMVNVEFTKKDGTLRKMLCTKNSNFLPEGKPEQADKQPRSRKEGQMIVWDMDKLEFRSFNLDQVISFEVVNINATY